MQKVFNTTGPCFPEIHYMVNINQRVDSILENLIEKNQYFAINRARQYGKTTTLYSLAHKMEEKYIVFTISFEELGAESFLNEAAFCAAFLELLLNTIDLDGLTGISEDSVLEMRAALTDSAFSLQRLSTLIYKMCRGGSKAHRFNY